MQERKTVAIVGCGNLGIGLGEALISEGHEVIGIRRDVSKLPEHFKTCAADVGAKEDITKLPQSVDVWVYAVAADGRSEESYRRAYEIGPENVCNHIARGSSGQSIYVSSTGVYDIEDGREVTEETPIAPMSFSAQALLAGETSFHDLGGSALRLGGIYGGGRHWLVRAVQEGRASLRVGPPRYTNRIQRDDAVGLLKAMVDYQGTPLKVVLGVDDEPAPWNEVITWIADALGVSLSSGGAESAPSGSRRASNKRCRSQYRTTLGYTLRYATYREGYQQVLLDMGLIS